MIALRLASLAALIAAPALAEIVPTSPSGNTVVTVGQDIDALWTTDSTGQWTDVEIQLMTGDNFQMVPLATLATGIDGTTASSLSIPCPDVSPYSKIYFLQFTLGGNVSTATWTTRFTIASASGETVAPEQSTVYNGETVQWGTGALVGSAPTLITGSGSSDALNSTTPASASASSGSEGSAAQVSTISVAPSASASAASDAMSMSMSMSMSASMSGSASSSASSGSATRAAAASASATPSSAALRGSTVGLGAVVLGLAGLTAV